MVGSDSSKREELPGHTLAQQNSIYANDTEEQIKMARTLFDSTPSVKIVVKVPKYAHDLLAAFYGRQLPHFYNVAVANALRQWADLEFDTTSPERLEVFRALDRLATARSILSWVSFDRDQGDSLEDLQGFERKQKTEA
jgi:hypothetical protein